EKIFFIINSAIFSTRKFVQIQSGYSEHFTCTFCITSCNDGCMYVIETILIEIMVYGISHCMTYAKYSSKSVCTWPQVCNFAKEFHGVTFLLQWITFGICRSIYLNFFSLYFYILTLAL